MTTAPAAPAAPAPSARRKRSAGRNLPAAIGVGVALSAILLGVFYLVPALLPALVAIAAVLATLEVAHALGSANLRVPAAPLLVAAVGIVVCTTVYGADGMLISTAAGAVVLILWRAVEATGLMAIRDVVAGIFTLIWVPFLGSFTLLLAQQPSASHKLMLALLIPIASDTGGYIAGVLFGRHPMAPTISPKKTWEGMAGSLLFGVAGGTAVGALLLPEELGALFGGVFGALIVVISTIGDLTESLLKRDLGIKDMGDLLPGHGGIMDRLDSILLAVPTLFILLWILEAVNG
ncbi:phosphatidate cytidylyltransferase [Helcobacillus massiliensis]|uniref:phosphatidate cytidylyltransferase n=1 Tax=Helcobacillus massiliensis TaxID=521392 RepID=UPI0021A467A9|nr:phosphatidate cytidylyltransferase [Helcobacillus massiliensis]MCT1557895.1 phosphatidate cytidylyltransferase [Helcobacillus massiliensis]MCT2036519.1 phosphatidate cytidylyltransferase [Helcobacillus massiliensis]MCT2332580.1 phosphatidate cytidylyltransferase [Helcobacillus massiliensis]MDK7742758.1 phosphatidate cytidylyltransferase [Helcobacillus massiliensis]WOO93299.1 phosphatidate cytidylyltransferase [Helcobacillus massiliensis]